MHTTLWATQRLAWLPLCSRSAPQLWQTSATARPATALPTGQSTRPSVVSQGPDRGRAQRHDRLELRDTLIVVEGQADKAAVQRVADSKVFFLKGASSNLQPHVLQRLKAAVAQAKHTIILTDPDKAGQLARTQLQQLLPLASHAFIPASQATSLNSSWRHEEGNTGVEHAQAADLRRAIASARPLQSAEGDITREDLERLGLVANFGQGGTEVSGVYQRRQLLCAQLGIGSVSAKTLHKQLNMFGFTLPQVQAALDTL